jgi:hypothetical protein
MYSIIMSKYEVTGRKRDQVASKVRLQNIAATVRTVLISCRCIHSTSSESKCLPPVCFPYFMYCSSDISTSMDSSVHISDQ